DDVDRRSHGVAGYHAPGPGPTPPPVIPWRVEHDEQGRHLAMTQPARRESMVGEINTLLGRGSEFEGKLTFEGTVRIDGTLRGEVFSDDVLIVGEGARVEAEIDVGEIIIQGTVVGNIRAKRSIEILQPGRVKG